MAHPSLALNFWIWHQSGPYFGMPVQNFLGWTATGALFMGLSRWLWGATVPAVPRAFPAGGVRLEYGVCDGAQRRWWRLAADRAGARVRARRRGAGHARPAHATVGTTRSHVSTAPAAVDPIAARVGAWSRRRGGALAGGAGGGPARRRPRTRTSRRPGHPGSAPLPPPVRRGGHPGMRAARGARGDRPRLAGRRRRVCT